MYVRQTELIEENCQFAGTGGVSEENVHLGFLPAFRDNESGQVEVSRFKDGRVAPCHLFDGLPDDWILKRDVDGRAVKIKNSVISGFIRSGHFFTRQDAMILVG